MTSRANGRSSPCDDMDTLSLLDSGFLVLACSGRSLPAEAAHRRDAGSGAQLVRTTDGALLMMANSAPILVAIRYLLLNLPTHRGLGRGRARLGEALEGHPRDGHGCRCALLLSVLFLCVLRFLDTDS